jgi:hypothetical protein
MKIPGFVSRWRERRQRLTSVCVVCDTVVTEWLRVGIDREYGCPRSEVEVLDCDDLLHLCVLCASALEEGIRAAITQTVTRYLNARGLAGTENKEM